MFGAPNRPFKQIGIVSANGWYLLLRRNFQSIEEVRRNGPRRFDFSQGINAQVTVNDIEAGIVSLWISG